jgi:hypothetical protein
MISTTRSRHASATHSLNRPSMNHFPVLDQVAEVRESLDPLAIRSPPEEVEDEECSTETVKSEGSQGREIIESLEAPETSVSTSAFDMSRVMKAARSDEAASEGNLTGENTKNTLSRRISQLGKKIGKSLGTDRTSRTRIE